ncbi:hypothetical protein IKG06_02445 [Candidatus Saccharibacteria bacterium]|nr:hypothetical protein [Candidatus Saccharibacteria bacterium]
MNRSRKIHYVYFEQIINLTNNRINFYDSNGNIAICSPKCHSDLLSNHLNPDTAVIVNDKSDATANNIPEDNAFIALVNGTGRNGDTVYRLMRIRDNAIATIKARDMPKGDVYYI